MKRSNKTRNMLFTSVVSLLLCVSMLVGTTFAWFTDKVESGLNTITAGNLDVELYYSKTKDFTDKNSVAGKTQLFTDKNGDPITYWEPGVVAYTNLQVANVGNLALKYQLSVNFENKGPVDLSKALQVAVVEGGFEGDRADAQALTDLAPLESFVLPGVLEGNTTSEVYGIVIYWEPTANDNQFNMNNENKGKTLSIDLGINLFATQEVYETDAFGPEYDEDAWMGGMKVYSAQDLQAAINAGETNIQLEDNIDLTESLVIPASAAGASAYSLRAVPNAVTINLNGKNISGALKSAMVQNAGNLILFGGTLQNTAENGGAVIYNTGVMSIENLKILGAPIAVDSGNPAYPINNYGTMTIEAGTHVSSDRGAMYLGGNGETVINGGTFIFNDLSEKLSRGYTSHVIAVGYGANNVLTINDGTFQQLHTKTSGGVVVCNMSANTVTINGGNFSGGNYFGKWDNLSDYGYDMTKTPFVVKGGSFTGMDKNYLAEGFKTVESNGVYLVVSENAITSNDELIAAINAGKTEIELVPGEYSLRFTNNTNFNLNDMTIKGLGEVKLAISSTEVWYGRVQASNVTFENIHFTSSVGTTGKATYNNCTFDSWAICASSNKEQTYFNNCTINGCLNTSTDFNSGNIYVDKSYVAKAEYSGAATIYFTDCKIGELISWDMATVLENCQVEKQDLKMKNNKATVLATDETGITYATDLVNDENVTLYNTAGYTGSTLEVPEGIQAIGNYAFAYNNTIETVVLPSTVTDLGRGFDSSAVKKVVLNEGLTAISSRAFRSTSALEEVVIPSTVKEIADNAFQKSVIKEIVIPANVETIGETAFGASKIEKVTFEGNTAIQGYAFRGCPNLREVYLNGDNVTFVASTLNGRNSMWFCNSESNNPGTSNITFHVVNETVAARVKTAMGAEANNTPVYVNGVLYEG